MAHVVDERHGEGADEERSDRTEEQRDRQSLEYRIREDREAADHDRECSEHHRPETHGTGFNARLGKGGDPGSTAAQ